MHVRIAWEIYHHQKKDNPDKSTNVPNLSKPNTASDSLHRPPSHIFPPSSVISRPPDLPTSFPPSLPRPFDGASMPASGYLAGPTSHLGKNRDYLELKRSILSERLQKKTNVKLCAPFSFHSHYYIHRKRGFTI